MPLYGSNVEWPPKEPPDDAVEEAMLLLAGSGKDHLLRHTGAETKTMLPFCKADHLLLHLEVVDTPDSPIFVVQMQFRCDAGRVVFPPQDGHSIINQQFDPDRQVIADALAAEWAKQFATDPDLRLAPEAVDQMHDLLQIVHYQIVQGELPLDPDILPE